MLLIDASALVRWVMSVEGSIDRPALAVDHEATLAPWLLWAELRNILIVSEHRGRLPAGSAEQITDAATISRLPWTRSLPVPSSTWQSTPADRL